MLENIKDEIRYIEKVFDFIIDLDLRQKNERLFLYIFNEFHYMQSTELSIRGGILFTLWNIANAY